MTTSPASKVAGRKPGSGGVPAFSFLVCPDSKLTHDHLEGQLASLAAEAGKLEKHVYWGDEEPPQAFWQDLTMTGLFGRPCAIVVRQANQWPAAVWKNLSRALARPSDKARAFFCLEVPWEKNQPKIPNHIAKQKCLAFADSKGWIWRQAPLNERTLTRHVQARARALGLDFSPDALAQFCASVPCDAGAIENELDKLVLMTMRRDGAPAPVTTAMTGTAAFSPDCNIFALLRNVMSGNLPAVWKELARNRDGGESLLFPLLSLMARDLRQLWQILAGEDVRLFSQDAGLKKSLAQRLGMAGVARGLAAVADAEFSVKSGRVAPDQALEFLLASMTIACSGKPFAG